LHVATAVSFDESAMIVTLGFDEGDRIEARIGRVEAPVVRTAIAKQEMLVIREDTDGWVVLGALRTSATPGVDKGEDYSIEAKRIEIRGDHEVALISGRTTQIVLRAVGLIDTIARDITTRAEGVQKIFGRMLHLN